MHAFYLERPNGGQLYCIHHPPQGPTQRGQILYLHPFADEMNKARRMAALQARRFASSGFEVLQIDQLGCGDSSGDFADATWQDWVDDGLNGIALLRRQDMGTPPLWLWGLRAGCMLAMEIAKKSNDDCNLLLVQPPATGKVMLQQFLRLKLAAMLLESTDAGGMAKLRKRISNGETLEVAGYPLTASLANSLESLTMPPSAALGHLTQLIWIELNGQGDAGLTPVGTLATARLRAAGYAVRSATVAGPPFWQTNEIELAPQLIDLCADMLLQSDRPSSAQVSCNT